MPYVLLSCPAMGCSRRSWSHDGVSGKIWWDDVRIEPAGLVNMIRRDGAPRRVTSEDNRTVYVEGSDFQNAVDPSLGTIPYPGGFTAWHDPTAEQIAELKRHARALQIEVADALERAEQRLQQDLDDFLVKQAAETYNDEDMFPLHVDSSGDLTSEDDTEIPF